MTKRSEISKHCFLYHNACQFRIWLLLLLGVVFVVLVW